MRSSSQRGPAPPSKETDGRTCGGGTGTTVQISHSGLQKRGSKPSTLQSSSEMFFRMRCASAAVSTRFGSPPPGMSCASVANSMMSPIASGLRMYFGWSRPSRQILRVLHSALSSRSRLEGMGGEGRGGEGRGRREERCQLHGPISRSFFFAHASSLCPAPAPQSTHFLGLLISIALTNLYSSLAIMILDVWKETHCKTERTVLM